MKMFRRRIIVALFIATIGAEICFADMLSIQIQRKIHEPISPEKLAPELVIPSGTYSSIIVGLNTRTSKPTDRAQIFSVEYKQSIRRAQRRFIRYLLFDEVEVETRFEYIPYVTLMHVDQKAIEHIRQYPDITSISENVPMFSNTAF